MFSETPYTVHAGQCKLLVCTLFYSHTCAYKNIAMHMSCMHACYIHILHVVMMFYIERPLYKYITFSLLQSIVMLDATYVIVCVYVRGGQSF